MTHLSATYEVDVTVSTHAALRRGVVELPRVPGADTWHRIRIDASEVSSAGEARLLAEQMACCMADGMCTSAVVVGWPDKAAA
jgi:hypothetical protein